MTRKVITVVLGVALIVTAAFVKSCVEGRGELRRAEKLRGAKKRGAGDRRLMMVAYARAVRWYVPGASHVETAVERLWTMAETDRKQGRTRVALFGYRRLRSALYSVRSFWLPFAARVGACNERIATILSRLPPTTTWARKATAEQRRRKALAQLRKDHAANPWFSLLSGTLLLAWLGLAGLALWRGFAPKGVAGAEGPNEKGESAGSGADGPKEKVESAGSGAVDGVVDSRRVRGLAIAAALCFVLWLVALYLA